MPDKLRVTLVKSPIGHTARTRGTLRALGLRRVGQTVEVADNDQIRGMTRTVRFLLHTEEAAPAQSRSRPARAERKPGETKAKPEATTVQPAETDARPRRATRTKKETTE